MQQVWVGSGERAVKVDLPPPDREVLPGLAWGHACDPSSPAYWAARCRHPGEESPDYVTSDDSLLEVVGFCLLGGFGIRYEINLAAYDRLKAAGAFDPDGDIDEVGIRAMLVEPLRVQGREVRYRFPNQRARRLASMRVQLSGAWTPGTSALELRRRLMSVEGVGPKTASWIVRNLLGSDEVAILDVHIIRACRAMTLFPERIVLPRDYDALERRFLDLARGIGVPASLLDGVMWTEVRGSAFAR